MRSVVFLTVAAVTGIAFLAYGQSSDLEQKVRSQYSLTEVTADRSDITTQGTVVTLQEGGLLTYSTASCVPYLNTYKKGKISQPFGGNLFSGVACGLASNNTNYPTHIFMGGERFSIIGVYFPKDGITFRLYSDPYGGLRYYGDLKFPFEKGSVPSPDEMLATITNVLTLQSADTNADTKARLAEIAGEYVMAKSAKNRLQLNSDGTLSLVRGGNYSGTFTITGNTLRSQIGGVSSSLTLQGDTLIDRRGEVWVRQKAASAAVPQLKLPATYVSTQTPADQLQLNSDNSFSLQEGGQPYHGNFTVNGNKLEITIDGTKTPMTIQGSSLTDPSGQTWALREQSSPTASSGGVLQNEDVIKMAKVGIDDATIITKIGSSKCQFDTSTDALIQLKQSGVNAAVLKAMVGATTSPLGAPTAVSGPAVPVSPSGVPTPLTPADGSIFDNFPRKTTVSWTAVPGAVEYRVEVDFSSSGVWASENPDRPTPPRTYSSKTTSFSFNFVGAQPGRWRVSAIDRGGRCSEPSPWWSFRYSR
jgi:hypothetical protein